MNRHCGDIFQLRVDTRWNGHAQFIEHIAQALHCKRGLAGAVAAIIQPDHQPIPDQRIGAHAIDLGEVFNPLGVQCATGIRSETVA